MISVMGYGFQGQGQHSLQPVVKKLPTLTLMILGDMDLVRQHFPKSKLYPLLIEVLVIGSWSVWRLEQTLLRSW